ncbi:MAG: NAD(P)(+) transhydrogenase (Re/Si-specific) subunit beta [Planctomycetales bacterium]|nr:NAD(P)(+) transhydrogenase (Re/Si-specific) subunit beta [Planctomycetales bacterium]
MDLSSVIKAGYVVSAILFIFGLKDMTHPRRAVRGNMLGAAGMTLAVLLALIGLNSYLYVGIGVAIGAAIGVVLAQRIQMTAMPQMVALFNGFGGIASVLVAGADLMQHLHEPASIDVLTATGFSGIIGAVTFSGSLIAMGKLQELKMFRKPFALPAQQAINAVLALVVLGLTVAMAINGTEADGQRWFYLPVILLSMLLGVMLVSPIGGADMPVVIALLNSYSGLAAAATGFVIHNNVLIIAGAMVGAAGLILTEIMCKAMNRSLFNVLFGVMEGGGSVANADEVYATVRSTSADDVAMILDSAQRVVFVPGYGMAVAQAQHAVRNLAKLLEKRDVKVEYAIHPVAGRMPGHMNVLLAEADVPYEQLLEMDAINPTMETVDVAIVIGANDVVNPVARTDPQSPIAGMPIIDVDKARTVVIIKRSLSPGFAGIPNPLFAAENALMLYGDGQKAVLDIVNALKES